MKRTLFVIGNILFFIPFIAIALWALGVFISMAIYGGTIGRILTGLILSLGLGGFLANKFKDN